MQSVKKELLEIFGGNRWNWILRDESNLESYHLADAPKSRYCTKVTPQAQWITNKYPFSEKKFFELYLDSTDKIIGVRPKAAARYLMIDIDKGSRYHPVFGNYKEFKRLLWALEDIGLTSHISVQSSYSEGLHLYFPFDRDFKSWNLANRVQDYLVKSGFNVASGQLELFPNKKSFGSLYNGHRLPLQKGSYILDSNFNPYSDSLSLFTEQWREIELEQDYELLEGFLTSEISIELEDSEQPSIDANDAIHETIERQRKKGFKISVIEKELIRQIEEGIPVGGITNDWLLNLTRRVWICGWASEDKLDDKIRSIVSNIKGVENISEESYKDLFEGTWCERLARWAVKNFKPYGQYKKSEKKPKERKAPTNEERAKDALDRIRSCIDSIQTRLEDGLTKLKKEICQKAQCSMRTLNKHWEQVSENFQPITTNSVNSLSSLDYYEDVFSAETDFFDDGVLCDDLCDDDYFFDCVVIDKQNNELYRVSETAKVACDKVFSVLSDSETCTPNKREVTEMEKDESRSNNSQINSESYTPNHETDIGEDDIRSSGNSETCTPNQKEGMEIETRSNTKSDSVTHTPNQKECTTDVDIAFQNARSNLESNIQKQQSRFAEIKQQQAKLQHNKIQQAESELKSVQDNPLLQRFHQSLVSQDARSFLLTVKSLISKSAFLLNLSGFLRVITSLDFNLPSQE